MTIVQELTGLDTAVDRGAERLLSLQHPDGWWKGELESNATMIAQHIFLLHFLGLRDPETDRLLANELLARRREDGTWSIWFEGPANVSVTVEAYAALKLAGVDAGDATRAYIRTAGGVPATRIFTRAFLALIGQWPLGRDPAAVGLVAADARRTRPRLRGRDVRTRAGRLGAIHGARRRPAPAGGVPVPRVGHGARGVGAACRRRACRRSAPPGG